MAKYRIVEQRILDLISFFIQEYREVYTEPRGLLCWFPKTVYSWRDKSTVYKTLEEAEKHVVYLKDMDEKRKRNYTKVVKEYE